MRLERARAARFGAQAVDDVQHAGRQQIGDELHDNHDRSRCLFGGLENDAIARRQRRGQFPRGHQDGKVPGDDLTDHTQRFLEMIGNRVVVDFRHRPFLGAQNAGEIAEMVNRQRNVGIHGFANRLAVIPGFRSGDQLEIGFDPVGDLEQQVRAISGGGLAPGLFRAVSRVESQIDVGGIRLGDLADNRAGDRRDVVHVLPVDRRYEFSTDEIVVAGPEWRARQGRVLNHFVHDILLISRALRQGMMRG